MTPASKSVYVFGIYLYIVSIILIFFPNQLLSALELEETKEAWIRVVGILAFCLGYYYHRSAANNIHSFYKHTVPTRIVVFIGFAFLAVFNYAPPVLIFFGAVDLAGAIWTWQSLKKR
jgi:hypothetical protein